MNGANSLDLRREVGRFALCVDKVKRESVIAPLYGSELFLRAAFLSARNALFSQMMAFASC